MKNTKFICFPAGLMQFQRIQRRHGHVRHENRLSLRLAIIRDHIKVIEEVLLRQPQSHEVIVRAVDSRWLQDRRVGKRLHDVQLPQRLGSEILRLGVLFGSHGAEVHKPDDVLVAGAGLGYAARHCAVDVLEVLRGLDLLAGTQEVDHDVGVRNHSVDHLEVVEVHVFHEVGLACAGAELQFLHLVIIGEMMRMGEY